MDPLMKNLLLDRTFTHKQCDYQETSGIRVIVFFANYKLQLPYKIQKYANMVNVLNFSGPTLTPLIKDVKRRNTLMK